LRYGYPCSHQRASQKIFYDFD
jgi:L-asparaginase/Glu-tRNA(Gln) amidotransferase subunit D